MAENLEAKAKLREDVKGLVEITDSEELLKRRVISPDEHRYFSNIQKTEILIFKTYEDLERFTSGFYNNYLLKKYDRSTAFRFFVSGVKKTRFASCLSDQICIDVEDMGMSDFGSSTQGWLLVSKGRIEEIKTYLFSGTSP